jgi:hypothetical protein
MIINIIQHCIQKTHLEVDDPLPELLALLQIGNRLAKAAVGQTNHLGADANAAFQL